MKNYEQFKRLIMFVIGIVIISLLVLTFAFVWYTQYNDSIIMPFVNRGNWLVGSFPENLQWIQSWIFETLRCHLFADFVSLDNKCYYLFSGFPHWTRLSESGPIFPYDAGGHPFDYPLDIWSQCDIFEAISAP